LRDVITRAGGLKDQGQDTWVVLERHGHSAAVPFGSLIYEPGNNIWARRHHLSLQGALDSGAKLQQGCRKARWRIETPRLSEG
jgi:hypothetical protein